MNSNGESGHDTQAEDRTDLQLLTAPADGVPAVVEEPGKLHQAIQSLSEGAGPVAIDAERAHGFRYTQRAYLIQLRRRGAGTQLIDPVALAAETGAATSATDSDSASGTARNSRRRRVRHPRSTADPADLSELAEAIDDSEWIIHAANQDLPCLAELNLLPYRLFDTELAGRLLGYPRVNLGTLVEEIFSIRLLKEHSAADWSTRPLPPQWLTYAALDVELLIELRDALAKKLVETGKDEWARQEFAWLAAGAGAPAAARPEPWRRTSGLHRIRSRRGMAIVAELWRTRDQLARRADLAPGRMLPDSALIEAASLANPSRAVIGDLPPFRRRPARHHLDRWADAVSTGLHKPEHELPLIQRATQDPPQQARAWPNKDPQAAARLGRIRSELSIKAAELQLPIENLLTPEHLRRLAWRPPEQITEATVNDQLAGYGARPWQREQTVSLITRQLIEPMD